MTRTTSDLIEDLDHTITAHDAVYDEVQTALVVGFYEKHACRMVFYDDPDRLEKLNTMVSGGGSPIGFIKMNRLGRDIALMSRPLSEYAGDPSTAAFFTGLCTGLGKKAAIGDQKLHSFFFGRHDRTERSEGFTVSGTHDVSIGSS